MTEISAAGLAGHREDLLAGGSISGPAVEYASIVRELESSSERLGVPGLVDRARRGLDVLGILSLERFEPVVSEIACALGASRELLLQMARDIHLQGPWKYTAELSGGKSPEAAAWTLLYSANLMTRSREMDLSARELVTNVGRLGYLLEEAARSPGEFLIGAREIVDRECRLRFEDGVPIAEIDNGFISIARAGKRAGILQDADGMLYVGTSRLDDRVFERLGLTAEEREDRGKLVTFYRNDRGEAVCKRRHPGFLVVVSRDFALAKGIVAAHQDGMDAPLFTALAAAGTGHTRYEPSSLAHAAGDASAGIQFNAWIAPPVRNQDLTLSQGERFREEFYSQLAYLKASEIFSDRLKALRSRRSAKGESVSEADERQTADQTIAKMAQKMEELRYMMRIVRGELGSLPLSVDSIVDLAGGAGDLGLAASMELRVAGRPPKLTKIVDPFPELAAFNRLLLERLPEREMFERAVRFELATLQETRIPKDAIVMAKHACGDLTDHVIEKWCESESPLLCVMTCCQDKAKLQPARYDISQSDWERWCRDSAGTNSPKTLERGMAAMTRLDEARVRSLVRHGFDAKLVQTDKFPKGDVIVARRR